MPPLAECCGGGSCTTRSRQEFEVSTAPSPQAPDGRLDTSSYSAQVDSAAPGPAQLPAAEPEGASAAAAKELSIKLLNRHCKAPPAASH